VLGWDGLSANELQPHEGSSETDPLSRFDVLGFWLQPHEGSSETVDEGRLNYAEDGLQPHEGSSETP